MNCGFEFLHYIFNFYKRILCVWAKSVFIKCEEGYINWFMKLQSTLFTLKVLIFLADCKQCNAMTFIIASVNRFVKFISTNLCLCILKNKVTNFV